MNNVDKNGDNGLELASELFPPISFKPYHIEIPKCEPHYTICGIIPNYLNEILMRAAINSIR